MRNKTAGSGEMPDNAQMENAQASEPAQHASSGENAQLAENAPIEVDGPSGGKQPDFRVVQPEYDMREGKTVFKDVGALWKNISQKTGREFYTLKIGKMRLLVFPNQKMAQQ